MLIKGHKLCLHLLFRTNAMDLLGCQMVVAVRGGSMGWWGLFWNGSRVVYSDIFFKTNHQIENKENIKTSLYWPFWGNHVVSTGSPPQRTIKVANVSQSLRHLVVFYCYLYSSCCLLLLNTLRSRQNGRHFSDYILICIKLYNFRLRSDWAVFLQAISHYLNQWWLDCRCIYA